MWRKKYKTRCKIFLVGAKKSYVGVALVSVHSKHGHKMEVCAQFHAPVALLPERQDVRFEIKFSYKC